MNVEMITTASPMSFRSSSGDVYLNPHATAFLLRKEVNRSAIQHIVERYLTTRSSIAWKEATEQVRAGRHGGPETLSIFSETAYFKTSARYLSVEGALEFLGLANVRQLRSIGRQEPIECQLEMVRKAQNKSPEMFDRLVRGPKDETGRAFFMSLTERHKDAESFFSSLIAEIYNPTTVMHRLKGTASTRVSPHSHRVFEFLGMAHDSDLVLFPMVTTQSGVPQQQILQHRDNCHCWSDPVYRPEAGDLVSAVQVIPERRTTHKRFKFLVARVMAASTLTTIAQCNRELFAFWLEMTRERGTTNKFDSQDRKTFNALITMHNSKVVASVALAPIYREVPKLTLDDFASFDWLRKQDDRFGFWANVLEQFISLTKDTQGPQRRSACKEFAKFLVSLGSDAPLEPREVQRRHINDLTSDGNTFWNYLVRTYSDSPSAINTRVTFIHQLFSEFRGWSRLKDVDLSEEQRAFSNPVDNWFDRVKTGVRTGTTRKSIHSVVLERMRQTLVEDDYAWAKGVTPNDWGHFIDGKSGKLDFVWCPSATILLYLMLSVPLRGAQARLLDSGVGDASIYDVADAKMVRQHSPEPVNGAVQSKRQEGVLQLSPSGMVGVPDILGIWVTVNKTSEGGYFIPWVSEELLQQIEYQRVWLKRYTRHPKPHGMTVARGRVSGVPEEWMKSEKVFFPLFRDAASTKSDSTFPVSPRKLYMLWSALCLETQSRVNALARTEAERICLIEPGTENDRLPSAKHDLHSLRVSGITDLLDRGVPLKIVSEYVAGHATYIMTLWYDKPAPAMVRNELMKARASAGARGGLLPALADSELEDMRPHLLVNTSYKNCYTGFDALKTNAGLILVRPSGICPGTRCEEGGLDEAGRMAPVPMGDRGPSCPQCRFWLTGPAFILGQAIEGNQLILKIRQKVNSLDALRRLIIGAEDQVDLRRMHLLQGEADIEERQLNDMLAEWWQRIKFYEASVTMLDDYRASMAVRTEADRSVSLITSAHEKEVRFGFSKATDLELKHFVSTGAEIFPEFAANVSGARQDIELAIGHFLAMSDDRELAAHFFKLDDAQRTTAANLTVDVLFSVLGPAGAQEGIIGGVELSTMPELRSDVARALAQSRAKSFQVTRPTMAALERQA